MPINNKILDDTEREFLTQIVKFYKKMDAEVISFKKLSSFVVVGRDKNNYDISEHFYCISFVYIDNRTKLRHNENLIPFIENKDMYKRMQPNTNYTLEELGINAPKHKITVNEFFKLKRKKKLAIHPGSEENAIALCKAFDEKGYAWNNTKCRYIDNTNYDCFKDITCYDNNGMFSDIDYYKANGYTIIEFEDVDLT